MCGAVQHHCTEPDGRRAKGGDTISQPRYAMPCTEDGDSCSTFRAPQCAWQTAPHNTARLAPVSVVAAELGWAPQRLIHNPTPPSSPPTLARASRPVLSDTEIRALPLEPPAAAITTTAPPAAARVLVLRDACCCLHRGAGGSWGMLRGPWGRGGGHSAAEGNPSPCTAAMQRPARLQAMCECQRTAEGRRCQQRRSPRGRLRRRGVRELPGGG